MFTFDIVKNVITGPSVVVTFQDEETLRLEGNLINDLIDVITKNNIITSRSIHRVVYNKKKSSIELDFFIASHNPLLRAIVSESSLTIAGSELPYSKSIQVIQAFEDVVHELKQLNYIY